MNKTNSRLFKFNVLEFMLLITIIIVLQFNSNKYINFIIVIFYILYTFFSSIDKIMMAFILLIPIAEKLNFIGTITIPMIIVITYFLRVIILLLYNKNNNFHKSVVLISFLLLFYTVIIRMIIHTNEQIITTIKFIMYLVFIQDFLKFCYNKNESNSIIFSNLIRFLGIGLIIASACSIILGDSITEYDRFSFGENSTINVIGIQSAFVFNSIILLFITKTNKRIDLFILAFTLVIVLLTMSKTAIFMIIIGIILYFLFTLIKGNNIRLFVVFFILCLSLVFINNNNITHTYLEKTLKRFQVDDLSNGRYDIWNMTVNKMISNKAYYLFGVGDYEKLNIQYGKTSKSFVAHNFLIETWVIYGSIGFMLIVVLLIIYIKNEIENQNKGFTFKLTDLFKFVPIISLNAGLLYSHHFIGRPNFVLYVIAFLPVFMKAEIKKRRWIN